MTPKLDLDSDILKEVRNTSSPKKQKWAPSDIILPINVKAADGKISTILKKIQDTTSLEFLNWLQQVMPFTGEMIKVFSRGQTATEQEKIDLFEITVLLHTKKWLFGVGESVNSDKDTKWS